ncbi:HD domain-containing protein [Phycicoccus sp. CSK15P-2]|uniref:HD-GYP domain-containing protein n=1 Tax=Phycicoccus sp. CSK15P-2 TaxID=2807627 RepID=UPI0019509354|nr:HD domain-containing phosphohydrolase [Phycicoccus sp. CSK15P-2]MBM6405242.1 HD domain-containing protein [Phycicoccus sp. CSK15P-2]
MGEARKERRIDRGRFYIALVATFALLCFVLTVRTLGLPGGPDLWVFCLLSGLLSLFQNFVDISERVRIDISSIVALAAQAILGPVGAAVAIAIAGGLHGRRLAPHIRVFNAATFLLYALWGGLAFLAVGGTADPVDLPDTGSILALLAMPMLLANFTQAATNLLLVAGIIRISHGVPMRQQVATMLRGTGVGYLGFAAIAFSMVVLWKVAALGPVAVIIVLAPLLVAQWAYRQHAEERRGQERALEVLVAAVEAKAPHLAGHSGRVAELSEYMAEHLGLRSQAVGDARMAGKLHDVGLTSLPTRVVRDTLLGETSPALATYPTRGTRLLGGLDFLAGALPAIETHQAAAKGPSGVPVEARIVGAADAYDLLTVVGEPGGAVLPPQDALDALVARRLDSEVIEALEYAVARRDRAETAR